MCVCLLATIFIVFMGEGKEVERGIVKGKERSVKNVMMFGLRRFMLVVVMFVVDCPQGEHGLCFMCVCAVVSCC